MIIGVVIFKRYDAGSDDNDYVTLLWMCGLIRKCWLYEKAVEFIVCLRRALLCDYNKREQGFSLARCIIAIYWVQSECCNFFSTSDAPLFWCTHWFTDLPLKPCVYNQII